MNRRLRCLTSEVESLRQDVRLMEEGVRSVADHLQASYPARDTAADASKHSPP